MAFERKSPRALQNLEADKGSDYVPLHILQEKYGAFYGATEQRAESLDPKRGKVMLAAHGGKRTRCTKEHKNVPALKAADMIRGFEPFTMECADEVVHERRNFAQLQAMHTQLLSSLKEMQCLAVELDLSFQSVKALPSCAPAKTSVTGQSDVSHVIDSDEFVLDVELHKHGNVHNVVLRSPPTWELHQTGAPRKPKPIWAFRSKALMGADGRSASTSSSAPPSHAVGDNAHTLSLDLAERVPEMVKLKRLARSSSQSVARPGSAARKEGSEMLNYLTTQSIRSMAGQTSDVERCSSSLTSFSSQCKMLERNFMEKYEAHYRHLLEQFSLTSAQTQTHSPLAKSLVAKTQHAELVANALRTRAEAKDYAQEYVREIRSALRLLGPILPDAVRVIEAAVKGLVVAFDASLSAAWQHAQDLQDCADQLQNERAACESLKSTVRDLQSDVQDLTEEKEKLTKDHHIERASLLEKMEKLRIEKEKRIRTNVLLRD